ncbi:MULTISPECIES: RNA polymerase sigma factor [Microbacterium]|uniref:RNA polymerase sigma factor n=1 Tax=Microbacterium TaxID=33882 RepID=UPI0023D981B1|nr:MULTISPECIES: sigma-70 family RNA polymerase sigma factor [Microbacterium]MDF2046144.1 sigma-70 family RNA polymerase sigma factor [Microbacterium sp. Kw_RZR3]MDQ1074087.1 RNA polymerase sigma factor (sigma-70 family) [Microbacterium sp. SORGH_AS_0969]MDQ1114313.1 RNA polymerase sigma factor (sigma-70 family) [Microbacterium testaceum]
MTPDAERRRFEEAVAPLMPDLLRYFVRRVESRADADDCVSETALALWRHRARLPVASEDQRMWAFGIARNVLANHRRKRARRARIDETLVREEHEPVSDDAFVALEALGTLAPADQELLRLVLWDGFGIAEAGALAGVRPAAARKRYERARGRLRAAFLALEPGSERETTLR